VDSSYPGRRIYASISVDSDGFLTLLCLIHHYSARIWGWKSKIGGIRGRAYCIVAESRSKTFARLFLHKIIPQKWASSMVSPALPTDLTDVTTRAYACAIGATCPCIHLSLMDNSYFMVGATIDHREVPTLSKRVAADETATRLPRRLVEEAVINSILQNQSSVKILGIVIKCLLALIARPARRLITSYGLSTGSIAHAGSRQ
jgi:hypothetical protein